MTIDVLSSLVDEGLSKVLSLVVIYAVLELIRKGPAWFQRIVVATENSTDAITANSTIIQNTEKMHQEMDDKIDDISVKLDALAANVKEWTAETAGIYADLKKELEDLKRLKEASNGF